MSDKVLGWLWWHEKVQRQIATMSQQIKVLKNCIKKKDEALKMMLNAHPVGLVTQDIGRCELCGSGTPSGMIRYCNLCADFVAKEALSFDLDNPPPEE